MHSLISEDVANARSEIVSSLVPTYNPCEIGFFFDTKSSSANMLRTKCHSLLHSRVVVIVLNRSHIAQR